MSDPRKAATEGIMKAVTAAREAERQRCIAIVANLRIAAITSSWNGDMACVEITRAIQVPDHF